MMEEFRMEAEDYREELQNGIRGIIERNYRIINIV